MQPQWVTQKDSLKTYFNNSIWRKLRHSLLPKTGHNAQTLPCKGVVRQPLVTLRKMHLEAQYDDFFQINTPIWVSIDLNGHSHKTIQYSSICKPCTKGMPGDSLARKTCASFAMSPTENENKHACCFCSTKLGSHWNSAALAPIEILHQLCSASAPRFRSSSALWPLKFCYDEIAPGNQNTLAAWNDDHLSWLNRCPPSGGT